jgi:hypothetical protein
MSAQRIPTEWRPEGKQPAGYPDVPIQGIISHRQVTDAYLTQLARPAVPGSPRSTRRWPSCTMTSRPDPGQLTAELAQRGPPQRSGCPTGRRRTGPGGRCWRTRSPTRRTSTKTRPPRCAAPTMADNLSRLTGLVVAWWSPGHSAAAFGSRGADDGVSAKLSASPRLWDRGRLADACQGRRGERTTAQLRVSGNGSSRTTGMSW